MNRASASSVSKGTRSRPAVAARRRCTFFGHILIVLAAAVFAVPANNTYGVPPPDARTPQPALLPRDGREFQVLFLGNSLTAGNDLASLVESMAAAGGIR